MKIRIFECAAISLTLVVGMTGCAHFRSDEEPARTAPAAASPTSTPPKTAQTKEASAEYHFGMAQAYVAEGNADRAIEEYKITLMYDPHSALVHARLATEYVKKGNLSSALESCKAALEADPNFIDARLMLAGLYSATRDTDAALAEYETILKKNPNHEETIIYKAQVLTETGRTNDATKLLNVYLKHTPESALAWYYLGRAEQKQISFQDDVPSDEKQPPVELSTEGKAAFKRAAIAYTKAIELRPSFAQAALSLGFLYEARHMNTEAIAVYRNSYDANQDVSAANRLTTIYLKLEKYKEAIPYLEAVAASDPDDMNVRVKLGLVQMEMKNYDRAIALFKAILEKNPDSDRIRYYLGSLYEETKAVDLAIEQLSKIPSESKLFADATLHIAYLYKQSGRSGESRTFVETAMAKSPRNVGFYLYIASLDEEGKDYTKAIKTLERAVKLFPEDEKTRYYLGNMFDRVGRTAEALSSMETLLSINPDNADALNYIGYTWTTQGVRLDDAEKLLKKALGLRPANGYIADSWGWYLFIRGRMKEAVVELEKAARLKPNESTILEHLADAYLRNNLREKALHNYQLAIQFADDEAMRRKLDNKIENLRTELARDRNRSSGEQRLPAGEQSPSTGE